MPESCSSSKNTSEQLFSKRFYVEKYWPISDKWQFPEKIRKSGFYEKNFCLRNVLSYNFSDVFLDEEHDSGIIFDLRKS